MRRVFIYIFLLVAGIANAQEPEPPYRSTKFAQLEQLLPTPNVYRAGNGAPGPAYWQQQADYVIKIELFEQEQRVTGSETVTYYNNSPQDLKYLWLQLDQNSYGKESNRYKAGNDSRFGQNPAGLYRKAFPQVADLGYKISNLKDANGNELKYTVVQTMMRIELPQTLKGNGGKFTFSLDWENNIRLRKKVGGRGGYEYFPGDDNCVYSLAQWYPRMAVFDDVNGWQNKQFLGRGEFALTFGDFEVSITVPEDHIVASTGELQNPQDVLSKKHLDRLNKAKTASSPVVIVTQEEAVANEKDKSTQKKTWTYKAENVRDFAWASSRKFIWDAMGVDMNGRNVWAMSYYPKEANPLWGDYSTNLVALTLKTYSKHTFDYPYPVAISVEASNGMEYPMICYNYGRPGPDGVVSPRIKQGMFGVIIHEVGHNYFPMIVNNDERQWTWMDEGLNSFLQYITQVEVPNQDWAPEEYAKTFPHRRGPAKNIVPYMRTDPSMIVPIMSNSESIPQFGNNAYGKPATALNILRETIMGRELFDYAFKEYSQRWMFKHPMPADFFRTMEDASAIDLDWFWRGWFYMTEACDISIDSVKLYRLPDNKGRLASEEKSNFDMLKMDLADFNQVEEYFKDQGIPVTDEERALVSPDKYYYQVNFSNVGGLVMPVIVQMNYVDGSSETVKIPAEIWRMDPKSVAKVFMTDKPVASFVLDPNLETADIDTNNNAYPREQSEDSSRFKDYQKKSNANK